MLAQGLGPHLSATSGPTMSAPARGTESLDGTARKQWVRQLTSHSLTVICTCLAICRSWALYTTAVSALADPRASGATDTADRASTAGCWETSSGLCRPGAETTLSSPLLGKSEPGVESSRAASVSTTAEAGAGAGNALWSAEPSSSLKNATLAIR